MKYNFFDELVSLCKIPSLASENYCPQIKKSSEIKKSCILSAQKQFVTPIDREDIVSIAALLHDLNCSFLSLSEYNFLNEFYVLSDIIKKAYSLAEKCLKNKLNIDTNAVLDERDTLYTLFMNERKKYTFETTINTKALIKNAFFDKIDKCFEKALSVIDGIVFISTKNS
jgi:hypothetical protein